MVNDVNTTGNAPAVRVRGWRSDQNQSPSFSGRVVLSHWRTGGAFDDTYKGVLGAIIFGANHTDGSESNIAYPASIEARAEGTFSNLTTMPTALVFRTGSTGIATEDTPDVDFGSERMRIDKDGNVGVGASVVNADLHLQRASGPVFRVTSEESVTPGGGNVVIGSVEFEGQYNNWYRVGARVSAREDGNWSSSDNSSAATALAFYTEDISTSSSLATERMTIRAGGTVGINEPIPLGQLHVRSADSGITSVSTTYDELVVEGSGSCGITVVSEAASLGGLVFTADDHAGTFRGFITYDHNDDSLSLGTSGTGRVDIDSYGGVNHNMTYSTVTSADYGFKSYVNHSWNNSGYTAYGHYFECNHTGANADDIFGAYFKIDATGTTVAGDITGMTIDVVVPTTSASVAGTATCLKIDGVNQGGTNNITNMYGIAIGNMNQAITNNTALYIAAVSDATNSNYAIQTAGGDVLFGSPCKFYTRRDVDAVSASGTYAAESFMVFSISSGTQTDMVRGLESTLVNNSTGGTITDMVALRAYMDAGPNSGASITWMSGLEAQVQLRTSGGPSPLNTSGVRIRGATNQQSNISNQYGLKIEDISGASTSNYSIYTGAGEIRLGASSSDECRVVGARDAGTDTTSALYINTTTGQLGLNSSSLRVKRDVVDMGDTEWLYDTRPVRFTHKDSGEKSYGLIAEELLEVQPDLVYMRPWDTAKQVSEAYKPEAWERIVKGEDGKTYARDVAGIHYDRFIPILINELKKLRGRILHLEAAMAA